MKVAIYGLKISKNISEYFLNTLAVIEKLGWTAILETDINASLIAKCGLKDSYQTFSSFTDIKAGIDLFISLGGD